MTVIVQSVGINTQIEGEGAKVEVINKSNGPVPAGKKDQQRKCSSVQKPIGF